MPASKRHPSRWFVLLLVLGLIAPGFPAVAAQNGATPAAGLAPESVIVAGTIQSVLGCPEDWQQGCAATALVFDAGDELWQATFELPAGEYEYKIALNGAWDESYGAGGEPGGANIALSLPEDGEVTFLYDHETHGVGDSTQDILTVPGSFQDDLGCPAEWSPDCLRSWLQDPDGDGVATFVTAAIPPGSYEAKVAVNQTWDVNYGADGEPGGANIGFTVTEAGQEVLFSYESSSNVLTIAAEGAPQGDLGRARAHWVAEGTIAWPIAAEDGATFRLHHDPDGAIGLTPDGITGGEAIELAPAAELPEDVLAKFPHLAGAMALTVPEADRAAIPELLKGQLAVSATAADGALLDATGLQIPGVLDDLFAYDGPLGATFEADTPTLRLWAPTARRVSANVYDDDLAPSHEDVSLTQDPATGVWTAVGDPSWNGKYYLYLVEVFVPETGAVETNIVTDPYAFGLSTNSVRAQIVDLADPALMPDGWQETAKPDLAAPEDIVLYELHVRDFSISDESVPEAERGTFKAFTQNDSAGMTHLRRLAGAGLTHVHLLPAFDIATIEEDRAERREPDPDALAAAPPDSEEQQAAVDIVKERDGYNWGYDPYHYTIPEGSYATDPSGTARIVEFREMVQALNANGLRVVMDVVYNHTSASGQDPKSVLDKIVPGYYHRLNADGRVETSTCCQNTATEHAMMEKLMLDSVRIWATAYKVDGFRFDLMGHHMVSNMAAVRATLDALTPETDGVDGKSVYVYGEGWDFGEVADGARGENATQRNVGGLGIGTFSDRLRDGARGGGPFSGLQEQGFVTGLGTDPNAVAAELGSAAEQRALLLQETDWIKLGLAGNGREFPLVDASGNPVTGTEVDYKGSPAGYTLDPQEQIVYVSAHDNETLFDAIQFKAPAGTPLAQRVRMQNLGLSLTLLSQGVPFIHAGDELLRSKSLDRNSYNSGDWFNRIDFSGQENTFGSGLPPAQDNAENWPIMAPLLADPALKPGPDEMAACLAQTEEMLRIRAGSPLFRLRTAAEIEARLSFLTAGPDQLAGLIVMVLDDTAGEDLDPAHDRIVVVFNAAPDAQTFADPRLAGLDLALHPVQAASADPILAEASADPATGSLSVPGRTTAVFVVAQDSAPPATPGAGVAPATPRTGTPVAATPVAVRDDA